MRIINVQTASDDSDLPPDNSSGFGDGCCAFVVVVFCVVVVVVIVVVVDVLVVGHKTDSGAKPAAHCTLIGAEPEKLSDK